MIIFQTTLMLWTLWSLFMTCCCSHLVWTRMSSMIIWRSTEPSKCIGKLFFFIIFFYESYSKKLLSFDFWFTKLQNPIFWFFLIEQKFEIFVTRIWFHTECTIRFYKNCLRWQKLASKTPKTYWNQICFKYFYLSDTIEFALMRLTLYYNCS